MCRLHKSLYGLKQSPRVWFSWFSGVIVYLGFTKCYSNHTCFIRQNTSGQCVILLVNVDDIIIIGDDVSGTAQVKVDLGKAFDVKELGFLRYFLRIEIAHSNRSIVLRGKTF